MTSLASGRRASRAAKGSFRLSLVRSLSSAALIGAALTGGRAHAICRVVESEDASPVAFDATTNAFFVVVDDVVIDYRCPEDDETTSLSEWGRRQLGDVFDHELPASRLPDVEALGITPITRDGADAGTPDAGVARVCRHGEPATEVHGPIVSLVIQPRLLGGGGHAGLVMPVAARPDVALGPDTAFSELAAVGDALSERVHETVIVTEDASLGFQCTDPHYTTELERPEDDEVLASVAAAPLALYGCGASDASPYYRPGTAGRGTHQVDYGDAGTVSYETIPVSDAYSVTALSASSLEALVHWMDDNGFAHDEVDDAAFSAYVGEGRWFVALDVHPPDDLETTELGVTGLSPLVVSWPGDEVPIQNRLQFDPDGGTVLTDAYVLAAERVDAEDESALTLAAGVTELAGSLASFGLSRGTLTHLRLARQQTEVREDSRIVAVSAVAPAPTHTIERTTHVRIPLACCAGGTVAPASAPPRTFTYERTYERASGMPEIPEAWFHSPEHASSEPLCTVSRSAYSSGGGVFCAAASAPVTGFGPIVFALWLITRRARRATPTGASARSRR